jgi:Uma2 family endonuclease
MTTTEPLITAEYLSRNPGLGRCELVRGELIMMSPGGAEHGLIIANIHGPLWSYASRTGLGHTFGAETGFQIARDPDTVRAPDVAFVTRDRITAPWPKGFFAGPPDLAVEVMSPDDRPDEVLAKVQGWLRAGCRVVWLVDPRRQTVHVYQAGEPQVLGLGDTLGGGPLLPGFSLAVADIFK